MEDIHHAVSNFEFTFLSSVLSTSSLRAMTIGVVAQFVSSVTKLHLSRNMPTFIAFAFFTNLKEGEIIAELLSVCRVTTKLSGNRQGGESPHDCECLRCSDSPMRCETFFCISLLDQEVASIPFDSCWSNSRPMANCFELHSEQLRCGVQVQGYPLHQFWKAKDGRALQNELNPYPETEQATDLHHPSFFQRRDETDDKSTPQHTTSDGNRTALPVWMEQPHPPQEQCCPEWTQQNCMMEPSRTHARLKQHWSRPCFGGGKGTQKLASFFGPTSSHLRSEDHEAGSTISSRKLYVLALFRLCHSVDAVSLRPGRAITSKGGYKRCVYGELGPTKQRKSVGDDRQARGPSHGPRRSSRLMPLFPCRPVHNRVLQREPSLHHNPCHGTGCAVVAKAVKTATLAVASGQGKGKVERRRTVRNCWEETQQMELKPEGHLANASAPALRRPSWATNGAS